MLDENNKVMKIKVIYNDGLDSNGYILLKEDYTFEGILGKNEDELIIGTTINNGDIKFLNFKNDSNSPYYNLGVLENDNLGNSLESSNCVVEFKIYKEDQSLKEILKDKIDKLKINIDNTDREIYNQFQKSISYDSNSKHLNI